MKKLIERELGTLTFAAGQTATLDLPKDYSYESILLRLVGTLYRAAGASAGAPKDLSFAQLVKRIEIRRNGRDVLKSIDMETLMRLNQLRYGTLPQYGRKVHSSQADVTTQWDGYAAVTTGNNAIDFDINASLDFGMWRSMRSNDTLLDATSRGNVSTLQMIITWGQYNDVMTPTYNPASGGVVADIVPTLQVSSKEYIDIDTPDDKYTPYSDNKEYNAASITVTANNAKQQIPLNVGNFFRSFVIKTSVGGTTLQAGLLVNDVISSITLRSGTDVIKFRTANALRNDNKKYCGVETMPAGYYLLEMCPDGHLVKMLNTTNMSSLTLELEVTGALTDILGATRGTSALIEVFAVEVVAAAKRVK